MGLNLATVLAPEGVTVNVVSARISWTVKALHSAKPRLTVHLQVQPAMIVPTGMIPSPKATLVSEVQTPGPVLMLTERAIP